MSILLQKFILFTHIEDFYLQIFICYKSSFCSPILKLSIFKYLFVTKVQFVHQYEVCNFQIFVWFIHLLHKFNLFTYIKTCIFYILIKLYLVTKVDFVHPYWSFQFPNIHLLQKFNLFTHMKFAIFKYLSDLFICYISSICSPISKLAFLIYWSNFYFVKKVQFVHPN